MYKKVYMKIAFFLAIFPQSVFAGCLNENAESRLANFCLVNGLNGKTIDLSTASIIDFSLKREGYAAGLGLPNRVERTSIQAYVTPTIDYNSTCIAQVINRFSRKFLTKHI